MNRKKIPDEIETSFLLNSARRCTLCFHLSRDLKQKIGQIAHLDQDPSNFAEDNLAGAFTLSIYIRSRPRKASDGRSMIGM